MQSCALRSILFRFPVRMPIKYGPFPPHVIFHPLPYGYFFLFPNHPDNHPMVFTMQKMRKCLNYRYFRIEDQMVDGLREKNCLFG